MPVATTAKPNSGTIIHPSAKSPKNGICTDEYPNFAKKYQPRTSPITLIIKNLTLLRKPATPCPSLRKLMISSINPTTAPPSSPARGNKVCPRSKLEEKVTAAIEITPIAPAIVGILRLNLAECKRKNTFNFSPVVLSSRCFFQNLYLYAKNVYTGVSIIDNINAATLKTKICVISFVITSGFIVTSLVAVDNIL